MYTHADQFHTAAAADVSGLYESRETPCPDIILNNVRGDVSLDYRDGDDVRTLRTAFSRDQKPRATCVRCAHTGTEDDNDDD